MRNNIMVNNTAYYNSTLNERGSSINVLNMSVNGAIEKDTPFAGNSIQLMKPESNNLITENMVIHIKNTTKEEETFNFKRYTNHIVKKDHDAFNSMTIDFLYNGISIKNGRAYSINVIEPQERYYSFNPIKSNVVQITNFEHENSGELIEFNNVFCDTTTADYRTNGDLLIIRKLAGAEELSSSFKSINANVLTRPEQDIIDRVGSSIAITVEKKDDDGWEAKPVIQVDVNNVMTGGGVTEGTNTGGDLKSLSFTIQQMSFFEFKLKFESKKVEDVFNLPLGLFFDKERQIIIGTPMQSGRYGFSLIFNNNSTLNGFIDVPKIQREL